MTDEDVLFDCRCLRFVRRGDTLYANVECRDESLLDAVRKCLNKNSPKKGEFVVTENATLTLIRSCVQALSPTDERPWDTNTLTPASDAVHFLEKVTPAMIPSADNVFLVSTKAERDEWPGTCWMYKEKKEPEGQKSAQSSSDPNKGDKKSQEQGSQTKPKKVQTVSRKSNFKKKWTKMCRLMDVVRSMLDASYRGSKMESAKDLSDDEKRELNPMRFFFDNWPNFAEAQLSSLLRMSVLGHFMRICDCKEMTLEVFKECYTTEIELSDCDIAYFLVQALRTIHKNEDKCTTTEARIKNTRLVFSDKEGTVFRQFKVDCACIEGERIEFVLALLKFLMKKDEELTEEMMKNKGSLTFQSLMERIFKEVDAIKEMKERGESHETIVKHEKEFLAYAMSVFFEVCTSDVIWPSDPTSKAAVPAAAPAAAAAAAAAAAGDLAAA